MKRASYALTVLVLLAAVPLLSGHGAEPKKVSEIMRLKLKNTQTVLEGLAMKDFKKISKHADELLFLSKEEEWKVLSTPDYENHSNEFRRNHSTPDYENHSTPDYPSQVSSDIHLRKP
jgi:hypothetical protein